MHARVCARACNEFICRNLCSCVSAVLPNSMVVLHGCCLYLGGYLVIPGKYSKFCASVTSIVRVEK